jgi:pilus assembly protein Flp/PilA
MPLVAAATVQSFDKHPGMTYGVDRCSANSESANGHANYRGDGAAFYSDADLQKRIQMKSFTHGIRAFLASEEGPTAVEYSVMLMLIIMVCLTAIAVIGTTTSTTFNKASTMMGGS